MYPHVSRPPTCTTCGAQLQPEHRFCPNCGTEVVPVPGPEDQQPQPEVDPSVLETSEFDTRPFAASPQEPPEQQQGSPYPEQGQPYASDSTIYHDTGHPTWGTPETTVPPEQGNRTLWIIVGIIAFIVVVCCCVLPLGLLVVANIDTAFQDELRSLAKLTYI